MSVVWTSPGALWLLAAVPLVWLAHRVSRTNFNPRQRRVQTILRSLVLVLLALALAGPVVQSGASRLSVVYLVDVSHSVSSHAVAEAATRIDALTASLRPNHSAIVAFGRTAAVVPASSDLAALAKDETGGTIDRQGTDLEVGLAAARAEVATGHVPRLILFSDGRPTTGDTRAALQRLAAQGVPVSVFPLAPRDLGDTWVDAIRLPERLTAGASFIASVEVGSQRGVAVSVELRSGSKVLKTQAAQLGVGMTTVPVEVAIDEAGAVTLEAILTVAADALATNNRLSQAATIGPRPRVLYVEGVPASARYLQNALQQSGFDVEVRGAAGLPGTRAGLSDWDVVILSDLAKAAIPDAKVAALAEWVEQGGGGLFVAGGEAVYGDEGYRDSELERLLPVTFERKDEPEVALIIILDKSWSMAGSNMEMAKIAAQAAVDVLKDEYTLGIITFNDGFEWTITPRTIGPNKDAIRKTIAAIEPSGHTLIFPAVEQAYKALQTAKARAKHVILLSDGRSYPDDYETLIKKMVAERMTISAVAMGAAADRELLQNIATWGKGRSYYVEDPKNTPQIFVKEAKDIKTPGFDEKLIRPIVKHVGFLEGIDFGRAPRLRGRTATVIKDTALVLLATEDGNDPLLAYWPMGAGRTAVFASDVKDRWAADWIAWRGYAPFFASIVRELSGQTAVPLSLTMTPGAPSGGAREVVFAIEAREPSGAYRNLQRPKIQVTAGPATRAIEARQVSPGRYEARVTFSADDALEATVTDAGHVATSRLVPDPAAEYRFSGPDDQILGAIATATGGTVAPDAAALQRSSADSRAARRAIWPLLAALALLVWFADLLARRIRFFEPAV